MALQSKQFKKSVEISLEDSTVFTVTRKQVGKEQILRIQNELDEIQKELSKIKQTAGSELEMAAEVAGKTEESITKITDILNRMVDDGADGNNIHKFVAEFGNDVAAITGFIYALIDELGAKK